MLTLATIYTWTNCDGIFGVEDCYLDKSAFCLSLSQDASNHYRGLKLTWVPQIIIPLSGPQRSWYHLQGIWLIWLDAFILSLHNGMLSLSISFYCCEVKTILNLTCFCCGRFYEYAALQYPNLKRCLFLQWACSLLTCRALFALGDCWFFQWDDCCLFLNHSHKSSFIKVGPTLAFFHSSRYFCMAPLLIICKALANKLHSSVAHVQIFC
jgi:hypothetical protein